MEPLRPDILIHAMQLTDDEWEQLEKELEGGTTKATLKPTPSQRKRASTLMDEELARARRLYREVA